MLSMLLSPHITKVKIYRVELFMKRFFLLISTLLLIAASAVHAVRVEIITKESDPERYAFLLDRLPGSKDKNVVLVVTINGVPFGEFMSGGTPSEYQVSTSTVYKSADPIALIAARMKQNGLTLEDVYIDEIIAAEENGVLHQSQAYRIAITEELAKLDDQLQGQVPPTSTVSPRATDLADGKKLSPVVVSTTKITNVESRLNNTQRTLSVAKAALSGSPEDKMKCFLHYCLHAETMFTDKLLFSLGKFERPIEVVNIYGNKDPCPQCQLLLSKLAALLPKATINYYSKTSFAGPCMLPASVCGRPGPSGSLVSTRAQEYRKDGAKDDDAVIMQFIFQGEEPINIAVYD